MSPAYRGAQVLVLGPKACESQIHARYPGRRKSLGKPKVRVWKRLGQRGKTRAQGQRYKGDKRQEEKVQQAETEALTLRASL